MLEEIDYEKDLGGRAGEICPGTIPTLFKEYTRYLEPKNSVRVVFPDVRTFRTLCWRIPATIHSFDEDSSNPREYEYNISEKNLSCEIIRLS
jgi:hypothetical protein